jgi:surface protein
MSIKVLGSILGVKVKKDPRFIFQIQTYFVGAIQGFEIVTDPLFDYEYDITATGNPTNPSTGVTGNYALLWGGSLQRNETIYITPKLDGSGFPRVIFGTLNTRSRVLGVENWGISKWKSMADMFRSCFNMIPNWQDTPDLSQCEDLSFMFFGNSFNYPLNFNVSNIKSFASMLRDMSNFNQDISNWNTSNATNMTRMIQNSPAFNQDLSGWCVPLISSRPPNFSQMPTEQEPIWGTCP